jgi:hypothetical protein
MPVWVKRMPAVALDDVNAGAAGRMPKIRNRLHFGNSVTCLTQLRDARTEFTCV